MNNQEPELKTELIKFDKLLNEHPDNVNSVIQYKSFIKNFLRITTKTLTLPTSEIMAVIKYERPLIFYRLKAISTNDYFLNFLTHIDMDYESAQKKLSEIRNLIK